MKQETKPECYGTKACKDCYKCNDCEIQMDCKVIFALADQKAKIREWILNNIENGEQVVCEFNKEFEEVRNYEID